MPEMLYAALAGIFGLLIGSFLNVCIHRWPRDLSVVRPRSRCPACDGPIAWYDNIPLLSWFALRGHCRRCRAPIPWRYPLVELLTALSFAYFVFQLGITLTAARYCVFAAILIALVFSDLETLLLPDELTLGGLAIGLLFSFFAPVPDSTFHVISGLFGFHPAEPGGSFGEAALGAFVPAAAIWLGGWLFEKLRHKEGLGFGDVKMLAMIGAFLGVRGALLTIILGSLLGSVAGLAFIKLTGKDAATYQLPFGTFLGAAAFVTAIEGQRLIFWYAHTVL
jgi:leader peptidase (prepilin peptidase)/N-methyltransferase